MGIKHKFIPNWGLAIALFLIISSPRLEAQVYVGTCDAYPEAYNCNSVSTVGTVVNGDIFADWSLGGPGGEVANSSLTVADVWVKSSGSTNWVSQTIPNGTECINGIKSPNNASGTWTLPGSYNIDDDVIVFYESWSSPNCGGTCCGFSYTTSSASVILPVDFKNFIAWKDNENVKLEWVTSSEVNNEEFQIMKSSDGINFTQIGKVAGNGSSSIEIDYEFMDRNPLPEINYYQLMQKDFDGNVQFSKVIAQDMGDRNKDIIRIYGEREEVRILNRSADSQIRIFNMQGQLIKNFDDFSSENEVSINISDLEQGAYFVAILQVNGNSISEKFVKL